MLGCVRHTVSGVCLCVKLTKRSPHIEGRAAGRHARASGPPCVFGVLNGIKIA